MNHWKETAEILARLAELQAAGRRAALATVVDIVGSAYRRPGAKLLIEDAGGTLGSVSGGCLEADVREVAKAVVESGEPSLRHYDTGDDGVVWGLGLGCNGLVEILVQPATEGPLAALAATLRELFAGDGAVALATVVEGGPRAVDAAAPAGPACPATPVNQASPANPANPAISANPANPATPATPANSANPASPANPASSANPATSANPASPVTPAGPVTPANAATSATPVNQVTPATSAGIAVGAVLAIDCRESWETRGGDAAVPRGTGEAGTRVAGSPGTRMAGVHGSLGSPGTRMAGLHSSLGSPGTRMAGVHSSLGSPGTRVAGVYGSLGSPELDSQVAACARALLAGGVAGRSGVHAFGGPRVFVEVLPPPPHLLVCGAGDDARALVAYAADVGFRVTLIDHRPALLAAEWFPRAARRVVARPDDPELLLPPAARSLAVVKTHSLTHDREWVRRLLAAGLPYVGLLGPRARTEGILRDLDAAAGGRPGADRAAGGEDGEPERVFGPVGLDLGADGPWQVAISIVAELLAFTAGREPRHLSTRREAIHAG